MVRRTGCPFLACLFLIGTCVSVVPARADEVEVRDFRVRVDGQPGGHCHLVTTRRLDGTLEITAHSHIFVEIGHINLYRYTSDETIIWKDDRLIHLQARGEEDGRPFTVTADCKRAQLHVAANGKPYDTATVFGTTACWRLPANCWPQTTLPLINDATGVPLGGQFHYLGVDPITVNGRTNPCHRFELLCNEPRDAWYDDLGRLVRQHQTTNGHFIVVELVRVRWTERDSH